jgi:hypothetical protein
MKPAEAELEILAGRLRARVAEGRFREAQGALAEYCRVLRKTVAGLPRGDPGRGRLEEEWRLLAEQTRRGLLAGRAHAGARLARLAQISQPPRFYGGGPPPPRRTWEYSA